MTRHLLVCIATISLLWIEFVVLLSSVAALDNFANTTSISSVGISDDPYNAKQLITHNKNHNHRRMPPFSVYQINRHISHRSSARVNGFIEKFESYSSVPFSSAALPPLDVTADDDASLLSNNFQSEQSTDSAKIASHNQQQASIKLKQQRQEYPIDDDYSAIFMSRTHVKKPKYNISNNNNHNNNNFNNNSHRHQHDYLEHKNEWKKQRSRPHHANNLSSGRSISSSRDNNKRKIINEFTPLHHFHSNKIIFADAYISSTIQPHSNESITSDTNSKTDNSSVSTEIRKLHETKYYRNEEDKILYHVKRRHSKRRNRNHLQHLNSHTKPMHEMHGRDEGIGSPQYFTGFADSDEMPSILLAADRSTSKLFFDADYPMAIKDLIAPIPNEDVAIHWPIKKEAIMEGDVILGGLMMVHSREDLMMCGPIMPQGGIQALEAMLYTLDRINDDKILLPNITIGAHILDDCDRDSYGLEMAVDFIKGSISNIDGAEYHCNKTQVRKVISGVVGAASSVTSIQVANLLRLFRIPQVSFFSTSPELSNKQRFEYFSRTIPSDHYQVKAMVDIVRRMGWSYISIIYEESNYGIKAFEELEDLLAKHNICIAVKEKLVKDSGVAEEIAYDNIVQKLLTKPRARGAIIFGSDQEVREVMRAVRRNNATGVFSWIGSDGWSARNLVSDGNEPEVEGTLSVQPQANPVVGFEQHFLGLTVENNQRNPWFVEFWEDHFQCRYPNSSLTPYNKKYKNMCTTREKLQKNTTAFEDQLQFVSDAVMAFAYALSDMHKDLCRGISGLCDAMRPTKGADLLKYLRKVNFTGLSGDRFHFNNNGDGPARYNIIHFKQVEPGKYRWIKVGEYYEGELRLNMAEVQFKFHQLKPPESVCSLSCEKGQAKKYVEGESCCWHCFNCSLYQIRNPIDETQCNTCPKGTIPDRFKQYCQDIPEQYLRLESGWAIGAMAFSSTGMLITLFVVGVFLRHNDTPVVRASGRELSYVLLAGIIMCYSVTFALVLRPSDITCGIQRFGAGFCFTVVYGALLTKTNRISRIFKHGKQSAKRPSFISPRSQLVICAGLTSVQVIINGVWMIISPARAMHHYPTREDNLLVCDSYIDASYMIVFSYPIFLIVICTVYAVLTRKIPEAFNESKHIGFTMYTTCVIWLAFVPLYFGTANHVPLRITSMSVTISLSASVTVACLFSPKLYIILIRPERNVRQSMMPVRYSAMNKTTGTGPSSMMAAIMVTAATCNQNEKIEKQTSIFVPEDANKLKVPTLGSNKAAGENGCVKFVEIATQTVNLTNLLTNLNSSLTNCHNTSAPFMDQKSISTIATSPTSTVTSPNCNKANIISQNTNNSSQNNNNGHCYDISSSSSCNNNINNNINNGGAVGSRTSESVMRATNSEANVNHSVNTGNISYGWIDLREGELSSMEPIECCDTQHMATTQSPTIGDDSVLAIQSLTTCTSVLSTTTPLTPEEATASVTTSPPQTPMPSQQQPLGGTTMTDDNELTNKLVATDGINETSSDLCL